MKNEITVATPRAEVLEHRGRVQTVTDLMGGQAAMRAAGDRYIGRSDGETKAKWQARVNGATLLNAYERTLAYLAGQVFAKDATLEDEDKADPAFAEFVENVDGQGNNLTVFAKRFFAHSINDGYGVVLVDSAAIQTRETTEGRQYLSKDAAGNDVWLPLTAADADMLGLRPRLIEVRAENVLGWRYEITGSRTRMVMLRLLESYQVPGLWDAEDETRQQVRVLTPGAWEVWRKPKEDKDEWALHQKGTLPGQEIPASIFRPGKALGEMTCAPALEALADKNVEHWQKQADHNFLMQWVRAPGIYVAGAMPEEEVGWGPGVLTKVSDPNGKVVPIGIDAPSVSASMAELEVIESQMALFGLQMLMPQTGNVTATEKALSAGESDSTLKGWASELKDCLEQAMVFVAEYMGMDGEAAPGLFINMDFHALSGMDDATLNALNTACNNGNLPREVLWSEFRRCGVIADDWTPDVIADLLLREAQDGMFAGPTASLLANKAPGQVQSSVSSGASDAA